MMKIVYAPSRRNASRRTLSDGTVAVGNRPREMTRRRCSSCPSLRTPGGKTALTESRNNSRPDLLDMPQCLLYQGVQKVALSPWVKGPGFESTAPTIKINPLAPVQ